MSNTEKAPGNVYPGNDYDPGFRESRQELGGHAAQSAANAGQQESSRELAFRHPHLRQGSTEISPFANAKPAQTGGYLGVAALSQAQQMSAMMRDQEPKNVTVQSLAEAGGARYRATPSGNPSNIEGNHTARNTATPPQGGSHWRNNPTTRPRPSMKSAFEVMKEALASG